MSDKSGNGQRSGTEPKVQIPIEASIILMEARGGYADILDPYLSDALEELDRVLEDLARLTPEHPQFAERIEDCVFMACELSRDATIRLIPFARASPQHLAVARRKYTAALRLVDLHSEAVGHIKPEALSNIGKYRANIQKRLNEYDAGSSSTTTSRVVTTSAG
jgi:hypothetical protein